MIRKQGVFFLCVIFCVSLHAGRKIPVLDKYRDVEIIQIDHCGITIIHRDGSCVIDETNISDHGKDVLKVELKEFRHLREEYQVLLKKIEREQTLQVEKAIKSSQKMKKPEDVLKILQRADHLKHALNRAMLLKAIEQAQKEILAKNIAVVERRRIALEIARKRLSSLYRINSFSVNYNINSSRAISPEDVKGMKILKEFQHRNAVGQVLYGYHIAWYYEFIGEQYRFGDGDWKAQNIKRCDITTELQLEEKNGELIVYSIKELDEKSIIRPAVSPKAHSLTSPWQQSSLKKAF